ncbi:MAG: response regulator transcription factor [Bryobacterales bacterium]|jgi:DNA-binding response OmpR family regulator|nr:response regulator transcription factor [Bryobacterales bacterium]
MRVLIVDSESAIAEFLAHSLAGVGYQVTSSPDSAEVLTRLTAEAFDILLVDANLPDVNGYALVSKLRQRKGDLPILMWGHSATVDERVRGLEAGADDFISKPFALVELQARMKALLRRSRPAQERLQVGDLILDCGRRKAHRGGRQVELAPREFDILEYLMRHCGQNLSRSMIVQHVWEKDYDGLTNIVDVYIRHLRTKLDDGYDVKLIQTVRGVGYSMRCYTAAEASQAV